MDVLPIINQVFYLVNWQVFRMEVTKQGYYNKLKNRLYGLLCEREKGGEWEKFLDTIQIELLGLSHNDVTINYWPLLGKIGELKFLDYEYFRKTIFECINLVGELGKHE